MSFRDTVQKEISEKVKDAEKTKALMDLWDNLQMSIFRFAEGPFPVSHGEVHICSVLALINKLLEMVLCETVCTREDFYNNLDILYSAALIHDVNMFRVALDTPDNIETKRQKHADYSAYLETINDPNNPLFLGHNTELICQLASCHANSFDKDKTFSGSEEKIKKLSAKYGEQYPYIGVFARILRFADLLDINNNRLNPINSSIFSKDQLKHYHKHQYFSISIRPDQKSITLNVKNTEDIKEPEFQKLHLEICSDLEEQFREIKVNSVFGWKIVTPSKPEALPPIVVTPPKQESPLLVGVTLPKPEALPSVDIYSPPERRIRIQTINECNLDCAGCHWDQFEKRWASDPENVLLLIKNLIKEGKATNIYPRPNISFTLTGGEPLINSENIEKFIIASQDNDNVKNPIYLLSNATYLNNTIISILKNNGVFNFRFSLNYAKNGNFSNLEDRLENIKNLIKTVPNASIRFNHLVRKGITEEISEVIEIISDEFKEFIPNNVKGIAFIQECGSKSIDIFKLAHAYSTAFAAFGVKLLPSGGRCIEMTVSNLELSFIKVNCDVKDDLIRRCFACVQEQDINIARDGSVRICSGLDENMEPVFKDSKINLDTPLAGLSSVIKSKYGIAGFYGHFPVIVKKLSGKAIAQLDNIPNFDLLNLYVLLKLTTPVNRLDIKSIISNIAKEILNDNGRIRKLYDEGKYNEDILLRSTDLCQNLLMAVYHYSQPKLQNVEIKNLLNLLLLILSYLTVDEDLFSTGRTIIARGICKNLLSLFSNRGFNYKNENFLILSTYCLATIAFEKITPSVVNDYINLILADEQKNCSCHIQYITGCIYRQLGESDAAIKAFNKSYELANKELQNTGNGWIDSIKEIRADAQRSLGAIKKKDSKLQIESEEHFLKSNFYCFLDKTKLHYLSLFSDGYAYMLKYFKEEFGKLNVFPENGYKAYINLKDSIISNSGFYASLIRIALLDIAFNQINEAIRHLEKAKEAFSVKGLLTDQEHLNRLMCELIYLYARYLQGKENVHDNDLKRSRYFNIDKCTNIGSRDIECVIEDIEILNTIIHKSNHDLQEDPLLSIINNIQKFIIDCKKLLPKEYILKESQANVSIKKFHHICLQTDCFEKSMKFYEELLGGELIHKNTDFHGREFNAWIKIANVMIELQTPKKGDTLKPWDKNNSGPVHLGFVVKDVELFFKRLKDQGHTNFKTKDGKELYNVIGYTVKIFKVIAPEGTEIEFRDDPNI